MGRLSSMFSVVTKNVRKYAEVTSARLSAMSTKASSSEIKQYLTSITSVCDKAQVCIQQTLTIHAVLLPFNFHRLFLDI